MSRPSALLAAILLAVTTPAVAVDDEGTLVAVVPVGGNAASALREAVDAQVRSAMNDISGVRLQPLAETRSVLTLMTGLGVGCQAGVDPARARCALGIGGLAGVDVIVTGDVEQQEGTAVVRLGAFDVVRQRALGPLQVVRLEPTTASTASTTSTAASTKGVKPPSMLLPLGPARERQLTLAVVRLLAPDQERGLLAVTVEAGTAIVIDRVPRGIAPRSPVALAPGPHELWLGRVGRVSQTHTVDVTFGETTRLDVTLEPDTDPGSTAKPLKLPEPAVVSAPSVRRIAVYDVEAAQLPPHLPALAQSALTIELRKLEGVVVVSMDEIRTLIDHEANRQLASCSDDTGCLAGIADALGADTIITVQLASVDGLSVYGARRLDTAGLAAATTVQERLKPDQGRELIAVTGRIVEQLFPDVPLRAGATRGPGPELVLRATPPPLPPAVSLGLVGVGVVGAGTTAVLGAMNLVTVETLRTQDDGAARKAGIASLPLTATAFWVGVGVSSVAIASAGVTALFTDWEPTP